LDDLIEMWLELKAKSQRKTVWRAPQAMNSQGPVAFAGMMRIAIFVISRRTDIE
jgi:hypothetical protein